MKALFKRSAPSPPPALPPATSFPPLEYRRDIQPPGTKPSGGSRHRAFSLSRDHNAGNSRNMVISQPVLQTELVSTREPSMYGRKRLQSGGITFDEVLPSFLASPGSLPPVPQLHTAGLSLSTPASHGSPDRVPSPLSIPISPAALSVSELRDEKCSLNPEDASPSPLALENAITTPTRTPRPSVRRRRGTYEVGIPSPRIDGSISPATGSYKDYVSCAPRPHLAGRRAASMGDVRGRHDLATTIYDSPAPKPIPTMTTLIPHSRVRSDQVRDAASTKLLAAAEIVRPRAISTYIPYKQLCPPRRPALARAAQMSTKEPESRQAVATATAAAAAVTQASTLLPTPPLVLTSTLQAAAPIGTPPLAFDSPAVTTPPLQGLSAHTSPLGAPSLRGPCAYPPVPYSPTSMFSSHHKYARNFESNVPFPQEGTSPRTVLSPPENPQMAAALQVDATRISLDKYDIHQDLTFVLRVQNVVADDVELELVKTVEGSETVFELKIKKKDPDNLRVRNGIIPYTYVPPFASPSSVSSPSSMYSSPLTTPTLEVPHGHHNGSYFPVGAGRSPRRNSHVNKPAASARLSHLTSRTPTAKPKQSATVGAKTSNGHGLELNLPPSMLHRALHTARHSQRASPISPTFKNRLDSATSAYDSDEDDGYDNASVLAHYTRRDTRAAQPESSLVSAGGEMTSSEEPIYGKSVFNSYDDDIVQERDDEAPYREVTFPTETTSYWSDTDAEAETEREDGEDEEVVDTGNGTSGDDSPTGPATP